MPAMRAFLLLSCRSTNSLASARALHGFHRPRTPRSSRRVASLDGRVVLVDGVAPRLGAERGLAAGGSGRALRDRGRGRAHRPVTPAGRRLRPAREAGARTADAGRALPGHRRLRRALRRVGLDAAERRLAQDSQPRHDREAPAGHRGDRARRRAAAGRLLHSGARHARQRRRARRTRRAGAHLRRRGRRRTPASRARVARQPADRARAHSARRPDPLGRRPTHSRGGRRGAVRVTGDLARGAEYPCPQLRLIAREGGSMRSAWRGLAIVGLASMAILVVAACGGGSKSSSSTTTSTESSGTPQIDAANLPVDFSEMAKLKGLASEGKGMIGVLLPDTTTSARYVQYDAPFLKKAFTTAGLSSDQFKLDNAHGRTSTMQQQAEADITAGASVL